MLDGGGIRGTFTAAVLARWVKILDDESAGQQFVKHFDLIAGTSTGAILAIGLALGLTPERILSFYREKGPEIFSGGNWTGSKYDSATLRGTISEILQNGRLSDSCCRLVIPTVRAKHGIADVIVTPHSPDRTAFKDLLAADAAMASASAPSYFDEHSIDDEVAE